MDLPPTSDKKLHIEYLRISEAQVQKRSLNLYSFNKCIVNNLEI